VRAVPVSDADGYGDVHAASAVLRRRATKGAAMSHNRGTPPRSRLVQTAEGSRTGSFGAVEWGLLASAALIWGSSFLFIDIGLEALSPGVVALARVGLGAATVALFPRARRRVDREDLRRIALLGVVWMAVPFVLFPTAQQWIDSSVAGMLNGAVPLTSAVIATLLLRRAPGPVQLVGLAVGFLGVVAIASPQFRLGSDTALGASLVLAAIWLYGLGLNIAVPLQQRYGALPVLLRSQLAALCLLVPFGLTQLGSSSWSLASAAAMIPLGALGTGLAFVAMVNLAGRAGAARGSVAIYFTPIVAIALGVAFRGEQIAPTALVGVALVITGAWLTSRRDRRAVRAAAATDHVPAAGH
jgi:drug/metabolite transporter (DMT)-like permease